MTTSAVLGIPYIAGQQSQPEVTHNGALNLLQIMLYGVISLPGNAPPGGPDEGDTFIVGTVPTGAWAGEANKIAGWFGGAWVFLPGVDSSGSSIAMGVDQEGMRVWSQADDCGFVWTGSGWLAEGGALHTYTVLTLPTAAGPKRMIYVSDESGGAVPAFNDGANWRRVTDRAIVS